MDKVLQNKFGTADQLNAQGLGGLMGFDQAGVTALIGNGNGLITQLVGLLNQFFRVRGAA